MEQFPATNFHLMRPSAMALQFPAASECGRFLDHFACEVAEYDDYHRTIRYTHPETQPDDALHATNYALLAGLRLAATRSQRGED